MYQNEIVIKSRGTMLRKLLVFFTLFFVLILVAIIATYIASLKSYNSIFYKRNLEDYSALKYAQLSEYFGGDLSYLEILSKSPMVKQFMEDPENKLVAEFLRGEIETIKGTIKNGRKVFFVSSVNRNLYFDTGYVYKLDENVGYWFDSTLNKTLDYNFNINYNPHLKSTMMWLNFPVFSKGKSVGMIGWGIDIDRFVKDITDGSGAYNLAVFNKNGELLLWKNPNSVKEKRKINSVMPQSTINELLQSLEASDEEGNMFFKDGSAYMINEVPFMSAYMVAYAPTKIFNGMSKIYAYIVAGIIFIVFLFLIFLFFFIKSIVSPLHNLNNLINTIFKEIPIYIAVFDGKGQIKIASRYMREFLESKSADSYFEDIRNRFGSFEFTKEFEYENGEKKYFKIIKADIENEEFSHSSVLYMLDMSEQMYLASTDSLTGLANKRYFNDMGNSEFWNCAEMKNLLSILVIDVDNFKAFNDKFGHPAGDSALKGIAKILKESVVSKDDFIGRIEGDEFSILLRNTDTDGAKIVAHKIRSLIEKKGDVTVSIGIYTAMPDSQNNFKQFLIEADKKLYEAKKFGKNRVSS